MLRIVQSASVGQAKRYYSEGLTREGYYSEGQEMAGHWGGRGAAALGLEGSIGKEAFAMLCDNINPVTGGNLTQRMKANRRVGWDFNWNLPKSVSLAYMWRKEEREAILGVVVSSMRATMGDIENEMATRVRKGGRDELRKTKNLISAEFIHFTSRPVDGTPDMNLHGHIYVFNSTFDPVEKQWKAAELSEIIANAGYYQAAFLMRVATGLRELGFEIEAKNGSFELAGIPRSLIEKFSRRAKAVEAKAKELGITTAEGRDGLAALTREKKVKDASISDLEPIWWQRLSPGT